MLPEEQVRTGYPPGLLQDDSAELSRWLAGRVGAWSLAREAAERAKRLPVCADRDLVKDEGER